MRYEKKPQFVVRLKASCMNAISNMLRLCGEPLESQRNRNSHSVPEDIRIRLGRNSCLWQGEKKRKKQKEEKKGEKLNFLNQKNASYSIDATD